MVEDEADRDLDGSTLGQMLRIVAHDLRNPLAVIISNLGYLGSMLENVSDDVRETIPDTLTSCEDLKHIIENVDLLGQQLSGQARSSDGTFSILTVTEEVLRKAEPLALSHGVSLVNDLGGSVERIEVEGEPQLYERAIANLLRNSIQHAPSGSEVRLQLEVTDATCDVSVFDTGTQLKSPWDASAFTANGQVSAKAGGAGRYGRGLGLYSAARAATALGASLSLPQPTAPFTCCLRLSLRRTRVR
jgi:signal transduction histidine kinase